MWHPHPRKRLPPSNRQTPSSSLYCACCFFSPCAFSGAPRQPLLQELLPSDSLCPAVTQYLRLAFQKRVRGPLRPRLLLGLREPGAEAPGLLSLCRRLGLCRRRRRPGFIQLRLEFTANFVFTVHGFGLGQLVHLLQHLPNLAGVVGGLRGQGHALAELRLGARPIALLLQHPAQEPHVEWVLGGKGHCAAHEVLRLPQPRRAPPLPQQVAQFAQRVRVVRLRFERAAVRSLGAREVPLGPQGDPEVIAGDRVLGVQIQSAPVGGDGPGQVPLGLQGDPEVVVGQHVLGVQLHGAPVGGNSPRQVPLGLQGVPEVVVGGPVLGIQLNGPPVGGNAVLQAAQLVLQHVAQAELGPGRPRGEHGRLLEPGARLLVPARANALPAEAH
mmetsp:Transcript_29674/g.46692  ORF Transcript_29674/g.46692 Transcript_29674/m.46692 type:complete len:385 (+) Transcript_29674:312-1466(+)